MIEGVARALRRPGAPHKKQVGSKKTGWIIHFEFGKKVSNLEILKIHEILEIWKEFSKFETVFFQISWAPIGAQSRKSGTVEWPRQRPR